jgi:segregation and condensation protein B
MIDNASKPEGAVSGATPEVLVPIVEALLFASPEPLALKAIHQAVGEEVDREVVAAALELLQERSAAEGRGIRLEEVAGGWQFLTRHEYFPYVQRVARTRTEERMTPAAVETLAIVAYKQPVTRAEVDAIRGVACGPILRTLMEKGLVRVTGRADVPGHPFQYGTTRTFLKHFGLKSPRDLPDPQELSRLIAEQGG